MTCSIDYLHLCACTFCFIQYVHVCMYVFISVLYCTACIHTYLGVEGSNSFDLQLTTVYCL